MKDGHLKPSILSNFVDVTQNEKNGVDEVLDYYGGQCLYSVGIDYSTSKPNIKYFELELSKSEILDQQHEQLEISSSNIAYLFYKNLRKDKHNYQEIHVEIKSNGKIVDQSIYKIKDLEQIHSNQNNLKEIVELFTTKQYSEVLQRIDTNSSFALNQPSDLIEGLIKTDSTFGNFVAEDPFLLSGFKPLDNKYDTIRFYGVQLREIRNCEFRIDLIATKTDKNIISFAYKY